MRYSVPDEGNIQVDKFLIELFRDIIDHMDNVNYVEIPICSGDCYVPFITIRTISDFANGNDDFERLASYYSSEIIHKCIEKLLTNGL